MNHLILLLPVTRVFPLLVGPPPFLGARARAWTSLLHDRLEVSVASPVVVTAARRSSRRWWPARSQQDLVFLLVDQPFFQQEVDEQTIRPYVLKPFAFYDVAADMLHANPEVITVIPTSGPRVEYAEIFAEPYQAKKARQELVTHIPSYKVTLSSLFSPCPFFTSRWLVV